MTANVKGSLQLHLAQADARRKRKGRTVNEWKEKHRPKAITTRFRTTFEQTIEDAMKAVFGDTGTHAVLYHLEHKFGIRRYEITKKPEEFLLGIEEIFGDGKQIFEKALVKALCSEFDLQPAKLKGRRFADIASAARTSFEASYR